MGAVRATVDNWERLASLFRRGFAMREDDLPIDEWCEQNVRLPAVLAENGVLSLATSQYLVAPMRHFQNTTTREINFKKPTRFGGSLFVDLCYFWAIKNRPFPWLYVAQSLAAAKFHAETRIWPALDSMRWYDDFQPIFHVSRAITQGTHRNGMSFKFTAATKRQLQSTGYGTVVLDEPWQYQAGIIDEAKGRLSDYKLMGVDKLLCVSQGGNMFDHRDWQTQFDSAPLFEWRAPCDGCGKLMPLKWSGLRDDRTRWGVVYESTEDPVTSLRSIESAKESVRFECVYCGHEHKDSERIRRRWNSEGGYYHEDRGGVLLHERDYSGEKISFRGTSLITTSLKVLVGEWVSALNDIDATGSHSKFGAFVNKRLAEELDDIQDMSVTLATATDGVDDGDGTPAWENTLHVCMTVDCQLDHFWAWVEAVSEAGDTMVLLAERVETLPEIEQIQQRFDIAPGMVGLDVSSNRSQWARQIAKYGKVINGKFVSWWGLSGREMQLGWSHYDAVKNQKVRRPYDITRIDPSLGINDMAQRKFFKRRGVPCLEFAANQSKDMTWRRHKNGLMKFHPEVDTTLVGRHFQGEHRVKERGKEVWKPIGKRPNHLWDCANMATVLLTVAGYATIDVNDAIRGSEPGDA